VVRDYDPNWRVVFERLRSTIWPAVSDVATTIEHVGSTSVEGLPAKPVIDMTIVLPEQSRMSPLIHALAGVGYHHRGDLGIPGRECFENSAATPEHHLYGCVEGNLGLRNHLALRDHLRRHPAVAQAYGQLKKRLAVQFRHDLDGYIEGKSEFILNVLAQVGFTQAELDAIRSVNAQE
jgi:GrpB-like predicted nucleotidyltransferase (UPF0157 family)